MLETLNHAPRIIEFGLKSSLLILFSLFLVRAVFTRSSAAFRFGLLVASSLCLLVLLLGLFVPFDFTGYRFPVEVTAQWVSWISWAATVWAVGASLFLLIGVARFAFGEYVSWSARRKIDQLDGVQWSGGIPIIEHQQCKSPYAQGVLRPTIFVPEGFWQWEPTLRNHVVLHEVAHIKRGDLIWTQLFFLSLSAVWFFPPAWIQWFDSRVEQERCCDDTVIRQGVSPTDYCETLITICSNTASSHSPGTPDSSLQMGIGQPVSSGFLGRLDSLASVRFISRRILAAIDRDVSRSPLSRKQLVVLAVVAFLMTTSLHAFQIQFYQLSEFVNHSITVEVSGSRGDAEQEVESGSMKFDQPRLELNYDPETKTHQIVGFHFANLEIPAGAIIEDAYLTLVRDAPEFDEMNLRIEIQLHPDAPGFGCDDFSISRRLWNKNPAVCWDLEGECDFCRNEGHGGFFGSLVTPNLAEPLQAIVDLPEWKSGNSMAMFVTSYPRTALSTRSIGTVTMDRGVRCTAPRLVVHYKTRRKPAE